MTRTKLGLALLVMLLGVSASTAFAAYPDKQVRIIVPYPPGGSVDATARLVARALMAAWEQTVIVENYSGAGGNIGAELVSRAEPDGYTLLFAAPGPLVINKSLSDKLSFDPDRLTPVTIVTQSTTALITRPGLGIDSLPKLIAEARAHPDQLTYASSGAGSTSHLAAELFKSMAGVRIVHVPYKGSAPALSDVMGGHVDMSFLELSTALVPVREKQVGILAIGSDKRESVLSGVPTVAETLPGYLSVTWFALAAPPGTPADITGRIAASVAEALRQPDLARRLADINVQAVGNTPEQAAAFIRQERERWDGVVRMTGVKTGK